MKLDYSFVEQAQARARRERSEAVHRLIIAPIVAFFNRPAPKLPRHAARPHFARQGW
jgi:hypothetical protein